MKDGTSKANRVIGQNTVIQYLTTSLQKKRISSAYIFYGPSAVGKRTTAKQFLQALLCKKPNGMEPCDACSSCVQWHQGSHPDACILQSEQQTRIGIDDIRTFQRGLTYRTSMGTYRVGLIAEADILTPEASNALLKTLEEPPLQTVIVLCATVLDALPLTLRSRCQLIQFQYVSQKEIYAFLCEQNIHGDNSSNISHLAVGRPGLALQLLQNSEEYEDYRTQSTNLLKFYCSTAPARFRMAEEVFPRTSKQSHTKEALFPIFDILLWLIRDIFLIKEKNEEHIIHRFLRKQLQVTSSKISISTLLRSIKMLEELKSLLRKNVNPLLVIDHFCINV